MNLLNINPGKSIVPDVFIGSRFKILRHILLQLLLLLMTINISLDGEAKLCTRTEDFISWGSFYLLVNCAIYFNLYVLAPCYLEREKYRKYLIGLALTTVFILTGTFLLQTNLSVNQPMNVLSTPFLMLLNLTSSTLAIVLMLAGTSTFLLLRHWIGYNQRISELESTTLQSELKQLKRQINPHFLFNMLNNANVLLKKDPGEASQLLFKLEDLLRYQINDSFKERVLLGSDIRFLNDFLKLEKIRRDKFEYTVAKEGDINEVLLPPLLFIPFVENAVKHNSDSEHESYVHISFKVSKDKLTFQCINSLPTNTPVENKTGGLGLKNIRRRLELLYPGKHSLKVEENEINYKVTLHLAL